MALSFERTFNDRLRVRSWRHRGKRIGWPPGAHGAFELAVVESGAAEYRIGERSYEVGPGQAILVPAAVEHATKIHDGTRAVSLWIGSPLVSEAGDALGRALSDEAFVIGDNLRLAQLAGLLVEEARAEDLGAARASAALTDAILVELFRRSGVEVGGRRAKDRRIQAAARRIERDYAGPLSVDELAAEAHMSRFHFSRLFQRELGSSPYRYLLRTRLRHASQLLQAGQISVTEAALTVGFNDLGRFARAMQRELGVRPSELRGRAVLRAG